MVKRFEKFLRHSCQYLEITDGFFISVVDLKALGDLMQVFRNCSFFQYDQLIDIFAVDYPINLKRTQLNYLVFSLFYNSRILLRFLVNELSEQIDSIKERYLSADWLEREIWDMFGIFFSNTVSLRRILTDYGFSGHPLRRDFPLSGFLAVKWSHTFSKIILEPVVLTQEFRMFQIQNPWGTE